MTTLYGNDNFTIPGNMSTSQSTQSTQNTATTSGELKRYRNYWWKTGQMHSKARWEEATLPYELATEVPFDTYVERTDKYNIHGWWEWENGTIHVIELPIKFHERCIGAMTREVSLAIGGGVRSTNVDVLSDRSTTTKTPRTGKEADDSWTPVSKPQLTRGGSDRSGTQPWPNLVIEIAYSQSEANLKTKAETYWLQAGRAHDVIAIKIDEPIAPATIPSVMTAWHYCINNQTAAGAFNPMMYEFGTIDHNGNPIILQPGQCIINIQLACLYHGVPANVLNPPPPPPPQLPPPNPFATLPNPIPIDMFHVQFAILNN